MESRRAKAGRSLRQREIATIQTSGQDGRTSPNTQMHQELEDSRTPTVTAEENADTLYHGRNTAGKQPEPLRPHSGQSEDQATPRSSPDQEMPEEYTDASDQGPNRNPPGRPPAHIRHSSGAQTAHEPSGPTPLGNPTQPRTQDSSLVGKPTPATGTNTTSVAGASPSPSLGSQEPHTDILQGGYREAVARLSEAMREGATDEHVRNLQGQIQVWQNLIQAGQNLSQPGQDRGLPGGYPIHSRGGVEDSERYLRNERKKDMDRLAKAPNSPELRPRPKAHHLDNWVREMDNFFEMLMVQDDTKERTRWIISKIKDLSLNQIALSQLNKDQIITWPQLQAFLKNWIQDPHVVQYSNAEQFWNGIQRDNEDFRQFINYVETRAQQVDPEPFKNEDGSIREKEKIGFIWARIKPPIRDEMRRVGALARITTYADFERAVLNAEEAVRNQASSGRNPGGHQKRGHRDSNAGQTQPSKKPYSKRTSEGSKPGTPSSGKESQGQSGTRPTPSRDNPEKPRESFPGGKAHWKGKQGDSRSDQKKEKP